MPKKMMTCPDTRVSHLVYLDFRIGSELWDVATNEYLERYSATTGDSIEDLQLQLDWSFYIDQAIMQQPYRQILAHIRAVL